MIKKILILCAIVALGAFGWYFYTNDCNCNGVTSALSSEEFGIFKARCTADEIIAAHQKELLISKESTIDAPKVVYYPFLLMNVKYTKEIKNKTAEGILLWGLCDGEMITDVTKWEKTHGFEECIIANLKAEECVVLTELSKLSGKAGKKQLAEHCSDSAIDQCIKKKLIVEEGDVVRLHFENPYFQLTPATACNEFVVSLQKRPEHVAKKRYSNAQIEKFAANAFGAHFAIKTSRTVYLPVYEIAVHNTDGTFLKTYWNALNGKRMDGSLKEL